MGPKIPISYLFLFIFIFVPSVAEWIKALDFDASADGESWFEPRCGRPHFSPTYNGVRACGRNRTEAREREWAEGTVSSLPGALNVRIKFCNSTGIARSGGGVWASTTSYAYGTGQASPAQTQTSRHEKKLFVPCRGCLEPSFARAM